MAVRAHAAVWSTALQHAAADRACGSSPVID